MSLDEIVRTELVYTEEPDDQVFDIIFDEMEEMGITDRDEKIEKAISTIRRVTREEQEKELERLRENLYGTY